MATEDPLPQMPDDTFHAVLDTSLEALTTALIELGFGDAEIIVIARCESHDHPGRYLQALGAQLMEHDDQTRSEVSMEILGEATARLAARAEIIDSGNDDLSEVEAGD